MIIIKDTDQVSFNKDGSIQIKNRTVENVRAINPHKVIQFFDRETDDIIVYGKIVKDNDVFSIIFGDTTKKEKETLDAYVRCGSTFLTMIENKKQLKEALA